MFWEQNSVTKANINRTTRRTNAERELPITNDYERTLGLNGNLQYTNTRQENQCNLVLETPCVLNRE